MKEDINYKFLKELKEKILGKELVESKEYNQLAIKVKIVIKYYKEMKKASDYIGKMYILMADNQMFTLSTPDIDLIQEFQEYYKMLIEKNIKFNRGLIPFALLYNDNGVNNLFINKLKENVNLRPLINIELENIEKYNPEIWKKIL